MMASSCRKIVLGDLLLRLPNTDRADKRDRVAQKQRKKRHYWLDAEGRDARDDFECTLNEGTDEEFEATTTQEPEINSNDTSDSESTMSQSSVEVLAEEVDVFDYLFPNSDKRLVALLNASKVDHSCSTSLSAVLKNLRCVQREMQSLKAEVQKKDKKVCNTRKELLAQELLTEQAVTARLKAERQKRQADARAEEKDLAAQAAEVKMADCIRTMDDAIRDADAQAEEKDLAVKATEAKMADCIRGMEEAIRDADARVEQKDLAAKAAEAIMEQVIRETEVQKELREQSDTCSVCMDQTVDSAVMPCGHMCACFGCFTAAAPHCPICRGPASSVMRIFRS